MNFDMDLPFFLILCLNGLAWGMLLFLVSSGLTLIFGVLRILNFAHGSFYMLGAYLAFQFLSSFDNFFLALFLSPLAVAFLGMAIEYVLLRRIYQIEMTLQLLFTFALTLIIADGIKMTWGTYFKSIPAPEILFGSRRWALCPFFADYQLRFRHLD